MVVEGIRSRGISKGKSQEVSMWAGLALYLFSGVSWAEPPTQGEDPLLQVKFLADRGPAILIQAASNPVALPSCRAVLWERCKTDYQECQVLQDSPCGPMAPAIWVDQQGLEVSASDELGLKAGDLVRVSIAFGLGCTPGLPLEVASCVRIEQLSWALGEVKQGGL
jgi:hypothetical protein